MKVLTFLFVALLGVLAGCESQAPTATPRGKTVNYSWIYYESRLQAAAQLRPGAERDQALSELAGEAAREGNIKVVDGSIEKIDNVVAKSIAASKATILLAAHGREVGDQQRATECQGAAVTIASKISDPDLRQKTLKRLAAGDY